MNDDELIYQRVLRAPRELVWRCLTEPAELAHFWGPSGMATPIDGIVVEILIHQRNVPDTMRVPEARAGFLTSLDKLEEHLAHLLQGDRS